MTIVGDIAQGIYAHRGLSNWEEISPIFEQLQVERINQNYRSTQEIVEFNNLVLQAAYKDDSSPAIPFQRHGPKPRIIVTATLDAMYTMIATDIKALLEDKITHIGIIVKTSADCIDTEKNLRAAGFQVSKVIFSRDTALDYEGGVVILPVELAKGIEFQAALVLDVSAANYQSDTQYAARLLYVAVTRALHVLNLYTCSTLTPLLEHAKNVAELVQYR
jgi:DNA helicase-2/ATP-dependent DNA helicase PcrA